MSVIPWLADLEDLSPGEMAFVVLVGFVCCLAAGFILNAILKGLGFGPALNGVLALAGVFGGVYLRYRFFGNFRAEDTTTTILFAMGCAVLMFLALAFLKSRAL